MDDGLISQFVGITDSTEEKARQYLQISENNLEQAIGLFFSTGGVDLYHDTTAATTNPPLTTTTQQPDVIELDSDDDDGTNGVPQTRSAAAAATAPNTLESDEEMARRLQDEMYGGSSGAQDSNRDSEGYRAPIARTRETLVGPDSYDLSDPAEMRAAMREQMLLRQQARAPRRAAGVFNQQDDDMSIWNEDEEPVHGNLRNHLHERLARTTNGASRTSNTHTLLAQMYRPPFELISHLSWEDARSEGKEDSKWLLVNIQDPSIFDCQILNRDIWKHEGIRETIKENFIFMQYNKDDPNGAQYIQYYFPAHESGDAYPYIAIVDPRTGEQVKTWSGPPVPKSAEFLMQLHEFLDRYSLSATARNPVAKRKPEKRKGVDSMTEEEQLEMAMQASLANQPGSSNTLNFPPSDDPDALTRSIGDLQEVTTPTRPSNGAQGAIPDTPQSIVKSPSPPSPFASISSTTPHTEPIATGPGTTRIQFRHPTGRIVRRFALADKVQRIYEWLKAAPLEDKANVPFELVSMGKNLIDSLDQTIEQAGLRNGTVMVEFVEGGDE